MKQVQNSLLVLSLSRFDPGAMNMLSPANRSKLMSMIKSKGNRSTELTLAALLRRAKLHGWRRHLPLPGRPDFTFLHERVSVFVHGCFWHGCRHCYSAPSTNREFWEKKVAINQARDRRTARNLRARGYRVITLWECELKAKHRERVVARIRRALKR